jgi:SecD/SecF fusion protein
MSPALIFILGLVILILFGWYFATDSEDRKRWIGTALSILMVAVAIASVIPPFDVPKRDDAGNVIKDEKGKPVIDRHGRMKKGIDLAGGTSFLIRLQPAVDEEGKARPITEDAIDRAVEVIRKRVDALGTSEPVIAPQPPDRILVQLPGVDPASVEGYREALKKVAKLEFRMVHPESESLLLQIEAGTAILDPAYEIVDYVHREKGKDLTDKLIVGKKVEITGDKVTSAGVTMSQAGEFEIQLSFDSEGTKQFSDVTSRMAQNQTVRERFAILMDKVCIQAAGLSDDAMRAGGLHDGGARITGNFEEQEARNIASALLNPLENEVQIEEERGTSASLGDDAIRSGLVAGYICAALTLIITFLYYRFAGFIANVALVVFAILLFGAMGMFGAVLTLPGIAGILLTLGMAIDANVLIYERLREEQAAGKSLQTALKAAYDKAFSAIFDSNLTTLITAGLLFYMATGPVKGFAVTLIIGIIASMFSALVVTRNLFSWVLHKGLIKKLTMANLIPATKFDFMGKRRVAMTFSVVVILACTAIFAWRGERNFGVDFKGGDRLVLLAGDKNKTPELNQVRGALKEIGFADAVVQMEQSADGEFLVIRDQKDSAVKIGPHLVKSFPDAKLKEVNKETVGAVVGNQLATSSLIALALGMVGIFIYVTARFEFAFALGTLVALIHDVVITIGVFSVMGRELSLVIVGAILTIAGYSVNDTIVVFDRIRENIKSGRPGSLASLMNLSINETLSRTVLTGGVTILTTLVLYFVGGPVLNDFALTMFIGLVVGTYSSVFVAAPIAYWWSRRGGRDLKSEVRKDEQAAVPA